MIKIHYDFSDGTEVSYMEGRMHGDNFSTHCLDFFNMDEKVDDVVVIRSDGKIISRKNIQNHTSKQINKSHNIHKMLLAGAFEWI
jgi:hypothetical protein